MIAQEGMSQDMVVWERAAEERHEDQLANCKRGLTQRAMGRELYA